MNWWQILLIALAANWLLPAVILWPYALISWATGDFVYDGMYGPFVRFKLSLKRRSLHYRLWRGWCGVGLFGFMAYRDDPGPEDDFRVMTAIKHEGAHCWQWLLGVLFYVLYMTHMAFIYVFQPNRHPYLDCWFERAARRRAGQPVNIPREKWPNGPSDRWPWW